MQVKLKLGLAHGLGQHTSQMTNEPPPPSEPPPPDQTRPEIRPYEPHQGITKKTICSHPHAHAQHPSQLGHTAPMQFVHWGVS